MWNDNKKFCAISAIVNGKDELETGLEAKMTLISINLLFIHSNWNSDESGSDTDLGSTSSSSSFSDRLSDFPLSDEVTTNAEEQKSFDVVDEGLNRSQDGILKDQQVSKLFH